MKLWIARDKDRVLGLFDDKPFKAVSGGEYFQQCIPYEGNEHLLGTTNDCDKFYKNWEE